MWSLHQECCPEHTTRVRTVAGRTESQLLAATRTQTYISPSVQLRSTINIQYMCLLQLWFHNDNLLVFYSNPHVIKMSQSCNGAKTGDKGYVSEYDCETKHQEWKMTNQKLVTSKESKSKSKIMSIFECFFHQQGVWYSIKECIQCWQEMSSLCLCKYKHQCPLWTRTLPNLFTETVKYNSNWCFRQNLPALHMK